MSGTSFPAGFRLERLRRSHSRKGFCSGESAVDEWLAKRAWQSQQKHLAATSVLVDHADVLVGFYTLAGGQADCKDLPDSLTKGLPDREVPVAILAWFGVAESHHGRGLGKLLFAQALRDCYDAEQILPFVAVVLDCINERVKSFYEDWGFQEVPDNSYRLFLNTSQLEALMQPPRM